MSDHPGNSVRGSRKTCDPRVALVCRKIEEELSKPPVKVQKLARSVRLSTRHLERLFTRELGMSVRRYQVEIRLETAAELLAQDSTLLVKWVCFEVGFLDPSYFARRFKKRYGLSPAEFKLAESV